MDTCFGESTRSGDSGCGCGEIGHLRDVDMAMTLAAAQQEYWLLLEVACSLLSCDQYGSATVGDNTAIEQVQRVSNHARVDYVLYRDGFAVHRPWVECRVATRHHSNLCELF